MHTPACFASGLIHLHSYTWVNLLQQFAAITCTDARYLSSLQELAPPPPPPLLLLLPNCHPHSRYLSSLQGLAPPPPPLLLLLPNCHLHSRSLSSLQGLGPPPATATAKLLWPQPMALPRLACSCKAETALPWKGAG